MSFSSDVKQELIEVTGKSRHCQLAELGAIVHFAKESHKSLDHFDITVENEYASQKYFTLLKKTFKIDSVNDSVYEALKIDIPSAKAGTVGTVTDARLLIKDCCRRAWLRGAFLCVGTISDPSKGYHLEFTCRDEAQAGQLVGVLTGFGIDAHSLNRKGIPGVYIKEGESIVDLLGIMGAHISLMNLENARILREISNDINRKVNCETANIAKTVGAAERQREDIEYIRDNYGLDKLPEKLRQMAEIRLNNPEATLAELGELLVPPVGKSGVNHRLRSLSEMADSLRGSI